MTSTLQPIHGSASVRANTASAPQPTPAPAPRAGGAAALAGLFVLAACGGGGGGGDDPGPYFGVTGKQANGVAMTVCIDDIAYVDPASTSGVSIARNLATVYGLVGSYTSYGGEGKSCRDRFGDTAVVIAVSDYNNRVLPAALAAPTPAPAPAPTPAPAPSPAPTPAPAPSPPPAPAPTPAPITARSCSGNGGSGIGGVQLYGQVSYSGLPGTANSSGTVSLDPGEISYTDPTKTSTSITGSLRATLWAVSGNYSGGTITGTAVARYNIQFTDGSNQLRNGESSNLLSRVLTATTPSRGSYCMVVTLEEYGANCTSSDGYCIADWSQFASSAEFQ